MKYIYAISISIYIYIRVQYIIIIIYNYSIYIYILFTHSLNRITNNVDFVMQFSTALCSYQIKPNTAKILT